ncbi:MAG: hypothetical protein ACQEQU_04420 [Spirochaetota bacterium]
MKRPKGTLVSIVILVIILTGGMGVVSSAESSFGAHMTLEPDSTGAWKPHPGIDFRNLGGRGIIGSSVSIDYIPTNTRGYGVNSSSLSMVSGFAFVQFSLYYGDLAFYAGPGLSLYYGGGDGGYMTLIQDKIIHTKLGGLYTYYPLQFFIEAEVDLSLDPFAYRINQPHISLGVSLLR